MSISDEVLNNMGSLESLISERGYTTGVVSMNGETIVRNEFDPTAPPIPAQNPYAIPGGAPQQYGEGVVPQPVLPAQPAPQPRPVAPQVPQVSEEQYQAAMAYANRMREAAEQAAVQRQEAEDRLWLESIAHLPQVEQDREILLRYNQQLETVLTQSQQSEQARAQAEEADEQENAKEIVAWTLATRHGLPWGNDGVRNALLSAPDRRTMDTIVAGLKTLTPAQQVRATQALAPQQQLTPAQVAANQVIRDHNKKRRAMHLKPDTRVTDPIVGQPCT
jgi:hypothetical protein